MPGKRGRNTPIIPRTQEQDDAIRYAYRRGVGIGVLMRKYRRTRLTIVTITGHTPRPTRRASNSERPTIEVATPVVQPEAISPMAFVRAFEERVREYHDAIEKLTQERNAARNETARLRVQLVNAVNGTKADLEQLEAAGKRVSSPLGGG
jgi:hypothetical protein